MTHDLARRHEFNDTTRDLVRRAIAPGATDDELDLAGAIIEQTGLSPFLRQICFIRQRVKEGDQWVTRLEPAVTIHGMRLIAQRTGRYGGNLGPYWCGADGVWRDVWLADDPPAAAKVGVLRIGAPEPFWGVARWTSFARKDSQGRLIGQWGSMADHMLAIAAERIAIRKGFPAETSRLGDAEEAPSLAGGIRYEDVIPTEAEWDQGKIRPAHVRPMVVVEEVQPEVETEVTQEAPEDNQKDRPDYTVCHRCEKTILAQDGMAINETQADTIKERYGELLCRDCRPKRTAA